MGEQKELDPEEELYHLQESTNEDGTVNVEITEWTKKKNDQRGEYVFIKFRLPSLKQDSVKMPWPKEDSGEWEFVRLVNSLGYSLASVNQIKGEEVKYDRDTKEIIVPDYMSRRERLRSKIKKEIDYWYKHGDMTVLGIFSAFTLLLSTSSFHVAASHNEYFGNNVHWIPSIIMIIIGFFGFFLGLIGLIAYTGWLTSS